MWFAICDIRQNVLRKGMCALQALRYWRHGNTSIWQPFATAPTCSNGPALNRRPIDLNIPTAAVVGASIAWTECGAHELLWLPKFLKSWTEALDSLSGTWLIAAWFANLSQMIQRGVEFSHVVLRRHLWSAWRWRLCLSLSRWYAHKNVGRRPIVEYDTRCIYLCVQSVLSEKLIICE